jgi:hypothetical protein
MARSLPQECIISLQDWMALGLAISKPLGELHHVLQSFKFQLVVDVSENDSEEENLHPGCMIREVRVCVGHGHANVYVQANGVISVHRKATCDSFLAAFGVKRFIERGGHILQSTTLQKCGDGPTYAWKNLYSTSKPKTWKRCGVSVRTSPSGDPEDGYVGLAPVIFISDAQEIWGEGD